MGAASCGMSDGASLDEDLFDGMFGLQSQLIKDAAIDAEQFKNQQIAFEHILLQVRQSTHSCLATAFLSYDKNKDKGLSQEETRVLVRNYLAGYKKYLPMISMNLRPYMIKVGKGLGIAETKIHADFQKACDDATNALNELDWSEFADAAWDRMKTDEKI